MRDPFLRDIKFSRYTNSFSLRAFVDAHTHARTHAFRNAVAYTNLAINKFHKVDMRTHGSVVS